MLKIDNDLLVEIGLGSLPEAEKNSFLKHIYETLEMRVGIRLADQMTNEQLDEFERYFEAKDDAGAFKWLETNFPNYKDIVQQEFDKLKAEVAQTAPQILSASQAQAAAAGQPQVAAAPAPAVAPAVGSVPAQAPVAAPAPTMTPAYPEATPVAQPAPALAPQPPAPNPQPMPVQPPQIPQPEPDFPPSQPPAGPSQF